MGTCGEGEDVAEGGKVVGGREGAQPVEDLVGAAAAADARQLLQHRRHRTRIHVEQPASSHHMSHARYCLKNQQETMGEQL